MEPVALDFEITAPARRLVFHDLPTDEIQHFVATGERQPGFSLPFFDARNIDRRHAVAAAEFEVHLETALRTSIVDVAAAPVAGVKYLWIAAVSGLYEQAEKPA